MKQAINAKQCNELTPNETWKTEAKSV